MRACRGRGLKQGAKPLFAAEGAYASAVAEVSARLFSSALSR